jgi:hypothetical protein
MNKIEYPPCYHPRAIENIKNRRCIIAGDGFRVQQCALTLFGRAFQQKAVYWFTDGKHCLWFPKLAVEKGGHLEAPPNISWLNLLSADWSTLTTKRIAADPPNPDGHNFDDLSIERAIFAKFPGDTDYGYRFVGIFKLTTLKDHYGAQVFRRVAEDLSIDAWIACGVPGHEEGGREEGYEPED